MRIRHLIQGLCYSGIVVALSAFAGPELKALALGDKGVSRPRSGMVHRHRAGTARASLTRPMHRGKKDLSGEP